MHPGADTRGVVTATLIDGRPVVASGQTAIRVCALCGKRSRGRESPKTLLARAKDGVASVTLWSERSGKYAAEGCAGSRLRRSGDANLSGQNFGCPMPAIQVSLGMTAR